MPSEASLASSASAVLLPSDSPSPPSSLSARLKALTIEGKPTHNPDGTFAKGNAWAAQPGERRHPEGRPLGSSAKVIVQRRESVLTNKAVEIALNDKHREQGPQLRQFIDKLVPDATIQPPVVQINFAALPGGLTDEEWREARR